MKTSGMIFVAVVAAMLLNSCAGQQLRARSSVVDYLYPESSEVKIKPAVPVLKLPVKVGIAFVPQTGTKTSGFTTWASMSKSRASYGYNRNATILTAEEREKLLERVAEHFRKNEIVESIEVIPTEYLSQGGSFSNLDQIRTMYDIDIIALVSFDQVQFTDEGLLSLTYFTVVGAYMVAGEKNDTSTLMDTVVYDIKSRKLLFRAPGTSRVRGLATVVNLSQQLRIDSKNGFEQATNSMIERLDRSLASFEERVKREPEKFRVDYSNMPASFGGGGAVSFGFLLLLLVIAGFRLTRNNVH